MSGRFKPSGHFHGSLRACLAEKRATGHLKRIKRGIYLPVSHKALTPEEAYADPWSILPAVFPQSYIGGWSAANFWQLTEQIFNTTCVLTPTPVSSGSP